MSAPTTSWHPTTSHFRALVGGVSLTTAAVWLRRPDLAVLASPLLTVAIWSLLRRPDGAISVTDRLAHTTVREGEATEWSTVWGGCRAAGAEELAGLIAAPRFVELRPRSGAVASATQ